MTALSNPQKSFGLGILHNANFRWPHSASKMAGDGTDGWLWSRAMENWANFGLTECGYICIHHVPAWTLNIMYIHMHTIHRHIMHIQINLDTSECNSVGVFQSLWGVWSQSLCSHHQLYLCESLTWHFGNLPGFLLFLYSDYCFQCL